MNFNCRALLGAKNKSARRTCRFSRPVDIRGHKTTNKTTNRETLAMRKKKANQSRSRNCRRPIKRAWPEKPGQNLFHETRYASLFEKGEQKIQGRGFSRNVLTLIEDCYFLFRLRCIFSVLSRRTLSISIYYAQQDSREFSRRDKLS